MGFGYVAYSRVDPPLPKPPLVPVASLGCANTAAFMKMHLGVSPRTGPTFEAPQHGDWRPWLRLRGRAAGRHFVAAYARGLPVATAFRGFMAC